MSVAEQAKEIDTLIEDAKWNMHGEEWDVAVQRLTNAKQRAIAIKDKARIDSILELINKARNKQKVELT